MAHEMLHRALYVAAVETLLLVIAVAEVQAEFESCSSRGDAAGSADMAMMVRSLQMLESSVVPQCLLCPRCSAQEQMTDTAFAGVWRLLCRDGGKSC